MTVICAWCKQKLGEKPGAGETHTICAACREEFFRPVLCDAPAKLEFNVLPSPEQAT